MNRLIWVLIGALLISTGLYGRDIDQDEALALRNGGTILPLTELLSQALKRYPEARLLDAELEEEEGVFIYEIELLTDQGEVRELEINATTGVIVQDEQD